MQQRPLGRTGRSVSAIGLGTWQLGADWGAVSEDDALAVLAASVDHGVTLFDTADVYGDGRSESLIGRFLAERPGHGITVATKMGRRLAQEPENYTPENFRAWTERSRANLGVDTLDLVQLHCPPTAVIEDAATYDALDALVADGAIAAYGVSVETCAQALAAIARPNVTNVQIIFNPFRLKPLDEVLPAAEAAGVAIFARVPLASGLLSGKYTASTTFADNDHRSYNRHGEAFDRGETFSGVDYDLGPGRGIRTGRGRAGGRLASGGDPRVDRLATRSDQRHPRRAQRATGGIECGCRCRARRRLRRRGLRRGRARGLRPASAGGDPPALVTAAARIAGSRAT